MCFFWTLLFLSCFPNAGIAFPARYPPYDPESFSGRMLNAQAINNPHEAGRFTDKDLTIEWQAADLDIGNIEIRHRTELITDIKAPENRSVLLASIYCLDLDQNGLIDVLIVLPSLSNGLEAYRSNLIILFQTEPGQFREIQFETLFFSTADIVDLDGDGRYEVIVTDLVWIEGQDRKQHSIWLYTPYRIQSFDLVVDQRSFPGFNHAVQFTHKANNKPMKLTREQMAGLTEKMPAVIKSKVLT